MKTILLSLFAIPAFAQPNGIIADLSLLDQVGAVTFAREEAIGLGYALVTEAQQEKISALMHAKGKCGGYEAVNFTPAQAQKELRALGLKSAVEARQAARLSPLDLAIGPNPVITDALEELRAENVRGTVAFLSAFPNRYNRDANPNRAIEAMADRVRATLAGKPISWKLDFISHSSTSQKSIRLSIPGRTRASEIIVIGAHVDSISSGQSAPGADDNASGSASILEALRVLAGKSQPERTVEFFWYAGEESGLLGSSEIARTYKNERRDVVAALQLDMTMFPGHGKFKIMNTTDFTSAWLQNYLKAINGAYLNLQLIDDTCGYACSDHASWHRQGYPSIFPFEAPFEDHNRNIHTVRDVIDSQSDFEHALAFSKIALIMAMDLGNSAQRQPTN